MKISKRAVDHSVDPLGLTFVVVTDRGAMNFGHTRLLREAGGSRAGR